MAQNAAPRRYGPNGRLWNGKRPEEFNAGDVRSFLADTDARLNGKDDYIIMATDTRTATAPADMDTRVGQDAAAVEAAPIKLEVTVRPIEPRGKLIGFASVNFGGAITVHDFRVFNGENGLFVGVPSVKDASSRSGYRDTARLIGDDVKNQLNMAARDAYVAEVEKLQARAAAVQIAPEKPRIREQLDKAGQEAAKDNAARPAPEKAGKAARDDR